MGESAETGTKKTSSACKQSWSFIRSPSAPPHLIKGGRRIHFGATTVLRGIELPSQRQNRPQKGETIPLEKKRRRKTSNA